MRAYVCMCVRAFLLFSLPFFHRPRLTPPSATHIDIAVLLLTVVGHPPIATTLHPHAFVHVEDLDTGNGTSIGNPLVRLTRGTATPWFQNEAMEIAGYRCSLHPEQPDAIASALSSLSVGPDAVPPYTAVAETSRSGDTEEPSDDDDSSNSSSLKSFSIDLTAQSVQGTPMNDSRLADPNPFSPDMPPSSNVVTSTPTGTVGTNACGDTASRTIVFCSPQHTLFASVQEPNKVTSVRVKAKRVTAAQGVAKDCPVFNFGGSKGAAVDAVPRLPRPTPRFPCDRSKDTIGRLISAIAPGTTIADLIPGPDGGVTHPNCCFPFGFGVKGGLATQLFDAPSPRVLETVCDYLMPSSSYSEIDIQVDLSAAGSNNCSCVSATNVLSLVLRSACGQVELECPQPSRVRLPKPCGDLIRSHRLCIPGATLVKFATAVKDLVDPLQKPELMICYSSLGEDDQSWAIVGRLWLPAAAIPDEQGARVMTKHVNVRLDRTHPAKPSPSSFMDMPSLRPQQRRREPLRVWPDDLISFTVRTMCGTLYLCAACIKIVSP